MTMMNLIVIALFIETIVNAVKPIWSKSGAETRMSVAEIVSICIGLVIAVACKINALEYLADWEPVREAPPWVEYIFYIMTGVAMGRGPSFVHDLLTGLREWRSRADGDERV